MDTPPVHPPSASPAQIDKVRVIENSLLCFNLSWFGLLPGLGIVPAVLALHLHQQVKRDLGTEWNPAGSFAYWGRLLSLWGLFEGLVIWAGAFILVWRHLLTP